MLLVSDLPAECVKIQTAGPHSFLGPDFLSQQVWSGPRESSFLMSFQVVLILLVWRPHIESLWAVKIPVPKPLLGWDLITMWKIGCEVRL